MMNKSDSDSLFSNQRNSYNCQSVKLLSPPCAWEPLKSVKINYVEIYKWQTAYVELQESLGHYGYCYAWLDTALCPLSELTGKCIYCHDYPPNWTNKMKDDHMGKKSYLDSLLLDTEELESNDGGDYTDSDTNVSDESMVEQLLSGPPT